MMLKQITPFIPVSDLSRALEFYEHVLGFACTFQAERYAFIRRDSAAMRLVEVDPDIDLHEEARQQSCYIDVQDIDDLYAELKPRLDRLPSGRVRAPFDQDYGQREFHVIDLDATLIFFGEGKK